MLKILINGLQISNKNTGVQYYTQQLYTELIRKEAEKYKFQLLSPLSQSVTSKIKRINRIFIENFSLPYILKENSFDLYHSTNYVLPYFLNFPSVLTIHDLISLDYPDLCQPESVLYFKLLLNKSIEKAIKVIAVSKKVKEDILQHFDVSEKKIEVVYHGINTVFEKVKEKTIMAKIRQKYDLPEKYILFVGNIEPKKNLVRIIQAFDLLRTNAELVHKLIIVGKKGWKYNSVFNVINNLKINNEILFTGYVPKEDLPAIYSMADLFVFPSLYEGFGFPPLEAMACGIPVMVSDKGSLPEITGDMCLQVNPYSIQDISKSMYSLITDKNLREKSIIKGERWVKQFSWEKTATETIKVYEHALLNKKI